MEIKRKIKGERGREELWTYKEKSRERERAGKLFVFFLVSTAQ